MNGSTSEIDTGSGQSWKSAERLAMDDRGEALRIFDISQEKAPPSPKSLSGWKMIIKTQLMLRMLWIGWQMVLKHKMISSSIGFLSIQSPNTSQIKA